MEHQEPSPSPSPEGERKSPRIILVGGEKGGTGKTTLAVNLAICLKKLGKDVLLVDTDIQPTSTTFIYFRDESQVEPRVPSVQKQGDGVARELLSLAQRYEYLVVDAGGRDSVELRSAMIVADIMIVPVQPSSFDMWTLKKVDKLISDVQALRDGSTRGLLDVRTLINRAPTNHRSRDSEEATDLAKRYPNLSNIMETELKERKSFKAAATAGKGIIEWDDPKAKDEMEQLFSEIFPHG